MMWSYPPLARYLLRLPIWSVSTHYHAIRCSSIGNGLEGAVPNYLTNPMDCAYTLLGCGIVTVNQWRAMHNKSKFTKTSWRTCWNGAIRWRREFDSYCDVSYGQFYVGALKDNRPADAPPVNTTTCPADCRIADTSAVCMSRLCRLLYYHYQL